MTRVMVPRRPGQVGYRGTLARRLRFPNGVQDRATSHTGGLYINHLLSPLVAVSMTKPTEEDDGFYLTMVRTYKKKTTRGEVPADSMKAAVLAVKVEHRSIRGAAQDFGIPFRTLARYCAKYNPGAPQPVEAAPESVAAALQPVEVTPASLRQAMEALYPSPEAVRPLEKVGPRKETVGGRKKRKSAILTDTPVKMAWSEEQKITKRKKEHRLNANKSMKKLFPSDVKKRKRRPKDTSPTESENEDEDCLCIHCLGPYSNSKRGEDWVKCTKCERWAHEDCIPGDTVFYVCFNCDSDNDMSYNAMSDNDDM
uniref:HTH psq-type domain-containing protein n=1 Tax=Timema tahoe TaxID=61484 RepID=A0A7R9IH84_9NEOP|nr:unnamed protein product [Timema tahoe]